MYICISYIQERDTRLYACTRARTRTRTYKCAQTHNHTRYNALARKPLDTCESLMHAHIRNHCSTHTHTCTHNTYTYTPTRANRPARACICAGTQAFAHTVPRRHTHTYKQTRIWYTYVCLVHVDASYIRAGRHTKCRAGTRSHAARHTHLPTHRHTQTHTDTRRHTQTHTHTRAERGQMSTCAYCRIHTNMHTCSMTHPRAHAHTRIHAHARR